jgi:hypothetical protein
METMGSGAKEMVYGSNGRTRRSQPCGRSPLHPIWSAPSNHGYSVGFGTFVPWLWHLVGLTASLAGQPKWMARIRMRKREQQNAKNPTQQSDANRQPGADRPKLSPSVGVNWVSADKRAVRTCVLACPLVSSPGPPVSDGSDRSSPTWYAARLRACATAFVLATRAVSEALMPCAWLPAPGINASLLRHPCWPPNSVWLCPF